MNITALFGPNYGTCGMVRTTLGLGLQWKKTLPKMPRTLWMGTLEKPGLDIISPSDAGLQLLGPGCSQSPSLHLSPSTEKFETWEPWSSCVVQKPLTTCVYLN